jgi:hypothetical protein
MEQDPADRGEPDGKSIPAIIWSLCAGRQGITFQTVFELSCLAA